MNDIYDYPQRIKRYKRVIATLGVNGELALRFLDHLASQGLSEARISKIAGHLPPLLRLIDFRLADATRIDIERVVAQINGNHCWRGYTKRDKKLILRKLVQFAKYGCCTREAPVPPEVGWIRLAVNAKDTRITPERLLTQKDFEAMVMAADSRRDKAMLYVLFEGALRPGELLGMSVGSVRFKQTEAMLVRDGVVTEETVRYCVISVCGKTGLKVLPLVASYQPLLEWLELHPRRCDLAAPLWCSLAPNYKGVRLSYRHFHDIIKRLARRASLDKAVWPYLFRHSTLTQLAKSFTEAKLERYAGWVHGSKMAARYVHFSARDLEGAVLELHGIKSKEHAETVLKQIKCERCNELNPPGKARCAKCGLVLDKELAQKIEEDEKKELEDLKRQIAELKALISSALWSKGCQQSVQASQGAVKSPLETA